MSTKIYVGNLPYTCDAEQLKALFADGGRKVDDVAIVTDRTTGQPRGFAFVQMANADDAAKAIEALHGSSFGGRTLTVNEARPRGGRRRSRDGGGGAAADARRARTRPRKGAKAPGKRASVSARATRTCHGGGPSGETGAHMTPPFRRSRLPFSVFNVDRACSALSSSSASAQTGFTANRFDPSEKGSDWFENESLDYRGEFRPAFGILADYSKDPVVLRNPDRSSSGSLVSDQLYLQVGASIALRHRLRIGASLPLELGETGDQVVLSSGTFNAPAGAAVGDLRLGADFRLLGEYQSPFELAIGAQAFLPTGSTNHFTGDGDTRVMPRLMIAGEWDVLAYALRFGYETRGRTSTRSTASSLATSSRWAAPSVFVSSTGSSSSVPRCRPTRSRRTRSRRTRARPKCCSAPTTRSTT